MSELNAFIPHGFCISWDPVLLAMHVGSDFLIAIAYFSIPAGILWALSRRKDLNFAPAYYLFAAFILACGVTHVLGIWTLWVPSYYLQGYSKVFTAVVSMATAIYLLPKIPKILSLPSLDALTAINEELASRVKAHEDSEARLKLATAELEKSFKLQSEFLVNMSHEVRTPMTGVLGCLNLLQDERLDAAQKELVDDAQSSAKSLLGLLNCLLDLSKMDANEFTLNPGPVDVEAFSRDCTSVFRAMAREKGLAYDATLQGSSTALLVLVDEMRLRQVIQNLISNAIKFTDKGQVNVVMQTAILDDGKAHLTIAVDDSGVGIPEDVRDKVFERFYQVDGSTTRKGQGTGLGLAICKQLLEKMGGSIRILDSELGGARVAVELILPLQEGPLPRKEELCIPGEQVVDESTEAVAQSSQCDLQRRILAVDDVSLNRRIIQKILRNQGFEVDVASNGEEALQRLREQAYALVLMDCQMPVLDGYSTTEQIRLGKVAEIDPMIPIVALTGHATRQDYERCIRSGMNDYLVKPLDMKALMEVIARYTGAAHVNFAGVRAQ